MDNQPLISVIVPVYKVEAFLRPCVDSILAQTFSDFELILVDDGSPDNCGAICDEYAKRDSRVRVIHQQNGGLSAARNAGIDWCFANSNSQWLTFIDSDDIIHPQMLERMMECVFDHDADICVCDKKAFLDELEINPIKETEKSAVVLSRQEACMRLYDRDGVKFAIACGKIYKKCLFQSLRYPVGMQHEDEATTYKALYSAEKIVEIYDHLYFYRQNPNSIMGAKFSLRRFDALKAMEERIAFFRAHQEKKLAEQSQIAAQNLKAALNIMAIQAGIHSDISTDNWLSAGTALRIIRKNTSDEEYTYYLAMIYPKRLRPHAYWRKIKTMLGLPKT